MNVPEVVYRFHEFDFDVSLHAGQVSPADDAADHVAPIRIRKDNRQSDRHIVRAAKDCPVIEHNDGPALFPNRLGHAARLVRQATNGDANFQTHRIGTRGLAGFVFRALRGRTRLVWVIHSRGVFDRKCHGIPIMNGRAQGYARTIRMRLFSSLQGMAGYSTCVLHWNARLKRTLPLPDSEAMRLGGSSVG